MFAATRLGRVVMRVDGAKATVVADNRIAPSELAATKTHLVWTTGENGADGIKVGQHLVGMPLASGAVGRLADASAPALIAHVATTDSLVACSTAVDHKGEILTAR